MTHKGLLAAAGLCLALVLARPASAETDRDCPRQCLVDIGEKYLKAMKAHDPAAAPLADNARYTENGVELQLPDGMWRTVTDVGEYRLRVVDPEAGTLGMFSTMAENGSPIILASRLKVRDRKIVAIETVVARRDTAIAPGAGAGMQPEAEALRERPQFSQVLPMPQRRPRWKLIEIANSYFRALENNSGTDHVPPFASTCHRIENGVATTNRPWDGKPPRGALTYGCAEAFGLGYYREDTRLRDMRFLAVDEERGLVFAQGFFDHDATVRSYRLTNGQTVNVPRTAPWTWMMMETFRIADGKIDQVESVLLSVPYGMRPNWDDGWRMPSPQEELEKMRR